MADAVVTGAGPNGLAAANVLADEGWDIVVLEAADEPGGAVRSASLIEPGYTNDRCSAFSPLGVPSASSHRASRRYPAHIGVRRARLLQLLPTLCQVRRTRGGAHACRKAPMNHR